MIKIDKDKLMEYLQEHIDCQEKEIRKYSTTLPIVERVEAISRKKELIAIRRAVDFDEFTIFPESEAISLNISECKKALAKQFNLLQKASEQALGSYDFKSLAQITDAMLQVEYALETRMEAKK